MLAAVALGFFARTLGARRRFFIVVTCLTLPLSAATNLLVKKPFGEFVASIFGTAPRLSPDTPDQFAIAVLVFGALAEEVAKLLPFLILQVRRHIGNGETGMAGFVAGVGFGIGEALYLGASLATRPEFANRSALEFQPFISERIAATYLHGALTAIVLSAGFRARSLGPALSIAIALHVLANVGALLYQLGAIPAPLATILFGIVLVLVTFLWLRLRQGASADAGRIESRTILWHR